MNIEVFNLNHFLIFAGALITFRYLERQAYAVYRSSLDALSKAHRADNVADCKVQSTYAYGNWKRLVGMLQCAAMFTGIEVMGLALYGVWSLTVYLWGMV